MNIVDKVRQYGVLNAARRAIVLGKSAGYERYYRWRVRNAPEFSSPTPIDLEQIEQDLRGLGIDVLEYSPSPAAFRDFQNSRYFPLDYHGGVNGKVWDEKILEHWITFELLGLERFGKGDVFVDVAASGSPWAKVLRERLGLSTFAIDLVVGDAFRDLDYYRAENATATSFPDASIRGASLHCAFEMFMGNDDVGLIKEMSRILQPNGKVVIAPLYMHTHYCAYSTPEFYRKGYADPEAREYVRVDCSGVPSSRKYDARTLVNRVLKPIRDYGMSYRLLALRNKQELGRDIYCHFILEVTR